MQEFTDFYEAWYFLYHHEMFVDSNGNDYFQPCLDIDVVKVNPQTNEVDDDETKNTKVEFWLECGPWEENIPLFDGAKEDETWTGPSVDRDLDCGAPTFEEAILKLANLVLKKYGE